MYWKHRTDRRTRACRNGFVNRRHRVYWIYVQKAMQVKEETMVLLAQKVLQVQEVKKEKQGKKEILVQMAIVLRPTLLLFCTRSNHSCRRNRHGSLHN